MLFETSADLLFRRQFGSVLPKPVRAKTPWLEALMASREADEGGIVEALVENQAA